MRPRHTLAALAAAVALALSSSTASAEPVPTGNLPGWKQVFSENFYQSVPEGAFSRCYAGPTVQTSSCPGLPAYYRRKLWAYPDGWPDTTGNGRYEPSRVLSIHGGALEYRLRNEGGTDKVAAVLPKLPNGGGSAGGMTYGRYAVRFKVQGARGFKMAWLLWPDDAGNTSTLGEIDFPETADGGGFTGPIEGFVHHPGTVDTQDGYDTGVPAGNNTWHTAVTEWAPGSVTFYLDGRRVGHSTRNVPRVPMSWVLQCETSTDGAVPARGAHAQVFVDWMAAWKRG